MHLLRRDRLHHCTSGCVDALNIDQGRPLQLGTTVSDGDAGKRGLDTNGKHGAAPIKAGEKGATDKRHAAVVFARVAGQGRVHLQP